VANKTIVRDTQWHLRWRLTGLFLGLAGIVPLSMPAPALGQANEPGRASVPAKASAQRPPVANPQAGSRPAPQAPQRAAQNQAPQRAAQNPAP
jgi:hypothetical protein